MPTKTQWFLPTLLAGALVAGMSGCTQQSQTTSAASAPAASPETEAAPATAASDLRLERVVILMRHGVRSPTKAEVSPKGTNDQPWPAWSVDFGELTQHGYNAVRLVGTWDRANWVSRGLLSAAGCPAATDVAVAASAKSRTQATARAWIEGFAPNCQITAVFPASKQDDAEFHPLDVGVMPLDADQAFRAAQATVPAGGMASVVEANAPLFALLNHAMGCEPKGPKTACDISQMPAGLVRKDGDGPDVGAAFGIASTIGETFLLEYLEGMPMKDVAWGRLDRDQIEKLLTFHTIKFLYEGRVPYVAARAASPLASRMLKAVESGPKLTVLVGHDTNIADLGGLLDLHWQVPGYPRDDPPPGGAIGFELVSDAANKQFVHAFYRSQSMDQVRNLQTLDAKNAPSYTYIAIPGCAELCPLADFKRIVSAKLIEPLHPAPAH